MHRNVDDFGTTEPRLLNMNRHGAVGEGGGREREKECKILTGARLSSSCPTLSTQTSLPLVIAAKVARWQILQCSGAIVNQAWRAKPKQSKNLAIPIWQPWPMVAPGGGSPLFSPAGGLACHRRACPPAHIWLWQPYTAHKQREHTGTGPRNFVRLTSPRIKLWWGYYLVSPKIPQEGANPEYARILEI